MKISEHSDSTEMVMSTRVMSTSARAARSPMRSCWTGPSVVVPFGEKSTSTLMTAQITKRYVSPLTTKTADAPASEPTRPPSSGPTTLEEFIDTELRAMAGCMSARGTRVGSSAFMVGPLMALAQPMPATTITSTIRFGVSDNATTASTIDSAICQPDSPTMILRRLNRSAMAPPKGERISIGPSCAKVITPVNHASPVRAYASEISVMFCIHVPMFDARVPAKRRRNAWLPRAERRVPGAGVARVRSDPGSGPSPEYFDDRMDRTEAV